MGKIKNALISVSDKENLGGILKVLKNKVKIISSEEHIKIKKLGFQCKEVSEYTGFEEMLMGRVKLYTQKFILEFLKRNKKIHRKQMQEKNLNQ